jgi:TRAP-type C4-dicarboxylate transport system substrate-binding protein
MHLYRPALFTFFALLLFTAGAQATTLKIATIAPDGTTWMKEMRAGAKQISEKTDGRVKLKFYPGGVMGNYHSVMKKIRLGQLQGGAMTGGELSAIYPDMQIYSLPMVFSSYAEIDYVRPKIDPLLKKGLEEKGFVCLGISEGGFAYLMSNEAIRSIDDLQSHKVWIPEDDVLSDALFHKMGVNPIPLPLPDVYTGLQTGLIDTVGGTPMGALAFQWHTRLGAITDVPLGYLIGVLVVDKKRFMRLTPNDQKIVRDVMSDIFKRMDTLNREDNIKATDALKNQGIDFVYPSKEELATWKKYAEEVIDDAGSVASSPEIHGKVQSLLTEYRQQQVRSTP